MLPEIAAIIISYIEELWQTEQNTKIRLLQQLSIPTICYGFRSFFDNGSIQSRIRLLNGTLTSFELVNLTLLLICFAAM